VRTRLRKVLRAVLCALVVLGLLPGAPGVIEAAAHFVDDGHLPGAVAHEASDDGCGAGCTDDGCTPLCSDCVCCAHVTGLPERPRVADVDRSVAIDTRVGARHDTGPPRFGVKPGLFPPIA